MSLSAKIKNFHQLVPSPAEAVSQWSLRSVYTGNVKNLKERERCIAFSMTKKAAEDEFFSGI